MQQHHPAAARACTGTTNPAHPLAVKWDSYYSKGPPGTAPFDSARPSSQLQDYLCKCLLGRTSDSRRPCDAAAVAKIAGQAQLYIPSEDDRQGGLHACEQCRQHKPRTGGRVLELGCGTGASARWLARQGFQVTAADISAAALHAAAAASAAEGLDNNNPRWLLQDVIALHKDAIPAAQITTACQPSSSADTSADPVSPAPQPCGQEWQVEGTDHASQCHESQAPVGSFDFIYDCQVYHVLVRDQAEQQGRLPHILMELLNPGGLLMILAGNANEPEVGPNVLTAEQLLQPLLAAGFELVLLHQTCFDSTAHYTNVLNMRPLAWWVVLQRPHGS